MDTKKNFPGGLDKGKEAYRLYGDFQPDGVIAADDNAQAMFVVPYLKGKVETPVMFCGVNADPGQYGYPAANVSGILERGHIKESIALLQELVPSAKTLAYMARQSPTGKAVMEQVEKEAADYSAEFVAFLLPKTLPEALTMAADMKDRSDAMLVATMQGIPGNNAAPLSEQEVIPLLAKTYGKPIITDNVYDMKYGMLCAVAVSGEEQGRKAAKMLIRAMQGAPVAKIPITRNERGRRIINVSAMKALGITPKPGALLGVELIKAEE